MALKVTARHGGAVGATVDDITARVPAFADFGSGTIALIQMGMSVQNGGASQGTLIVPDPVGNLDASLYFPPFTQITLTEDASGDEIMLAQGRVSQYSIGRAPVQPPADDVQWNLTVDDANVDLRDLAFTEDWVRPAETGVARMIALAAYTLNGTSSTRPDFGGVITYRPSTVIVADASHLTKDTDTVLMPEHRYPAGTQPQDVADDCATTEGKVYGVVPHHAGGSHLCLLYIKESDHGSYLSVIKISDDLAEYSPNDLTAPVFSPIWDQGDGQRVDGNANISGLVSRYGVADAVVISVDSTLGDLNEYRIGSYQDGASTTAAQAAARASAIIAYRSPFTETDSVTVEILPEQTHLLAAGMSIQIKAAPINASTVSTVGTFVYRRVTSLQWEPQPNGKYHAIMQLNRPAGRGVSAGQTQPASTTPKGADLVTVFAPCELGSCSDTFQRSVVPGGEGGISEIMGLSWSESFNETGTSPATYVTPTLGMVIPPPLTDPAGAVNDHVMVLDFGSIDLPFETLELLRFTVPLGADGGGLIQPRYSITSPINNTAWEWWPSGSSTNPNGYGLYEDDIGAPIFIVGQIIVWDGADYYEFNDGAEVPGAFLNDHKLWVRRRGEAQNLKIKAWWDGNAEPVDWMVDITPPSGLLYAADPGRLRYANIAVDNDAPYDEIGGQVAVHSVCFVEGLSCSDGTCCTCSPSPGNFVGQRLVGYGDDVTDTWSVQGPYQAGSLTVWVDGLIQNFTEADPINGTFTLEFAPLADGGDGIPEQVEAAWRAG